MEAEALYAKRGSYKILHVVQNDTESGVQDFSLHFVIRDNRYFFKLFEEFMRKVVLVSLDAFFYADTLRVNPEGFVASMMRSGAFCRRVETIFPALTYPIHVTMVTGCEPDKTGVGQNQPPQPGVAKAERVWYWERKHIRVPTLFDAVKEAGGRNCSISWATN